MSDPDDEVNGPVGPQPEELGSAGPWRNVPQPSTDELLTPDAQVADPPQIPLAVKIGGLSLVGVLLLMSAWLGLSLGGSGGPQSTNSPTPTIDETLWDLDPPTTLGGFVVGETTSTPFGTSSDRAIVRANYADGTAKIVLLLSRPEDDVSTYLEDTAIGDNESVDDATCGTSIDNDVPVCVRVVDDTAIAVAGLSDQEFSELASLVDAFYSAMT